MIVKKITVGYVIQDFDTKTKKFVSQEFIAGDDCTYEDVNGDVLGKVSLAKVENEYLPYDMVQPK